MFCKSKEILNVYYLLLYRNKECEYRKSIGRIRNIKRRNIKDLIGRGDYLLCVGRGERG